MNNIEIFGIPYLKKGSGIHIKKKNRGKFTEYCGGKVTDECISRAKKSNNPKLRKRAIFAQNSRSWSKKQQGGLLKIAKSGTSLENPTKDTSKSVKNRPTPGFIPFTRRMTKKENKKDFKLSNKKDKVMGVKQIGINNKNSV